MKQATAPHLPMTSNPDKERLYRLDPAYRSGLSSAHEAFGDLAVVHRRALAVLRPDAFAFRRAHHIVDFLRAHDLRPIAWQPFRFSWHHVLDLWRYQLTEATEDRLGFGCELLDCGTSVLLLLAEERARGDVPPAVRLGSLKGASRPGREAAAISGTPSPYPIGCSDSSTPPTSRSISSGRSESSCLPDGDFSS